MHRRQTNSEKIFLSADFHSTWLSLEKNKYIEIPSFFSETEQ